MRIRPGGQDMHVEDSGANGFALPGAAPSADTAFEDVAYDLTIAATQTLNNGQYGHFIAAYFHARSRYGAVRRRESKIAGVGTGRALTDVQPLTNRLTKVMVLAFESAGWMDPTVQKLVNVWEQRASRRLGPDRPGTFAGAFRLASRTGYFSPPVWVVANVIAPPGGLPEAGVGAPALNAGKGGSSTRRKPARPARSNIANICYWLVPTSLAHRTDQGHYFP